MPIRKHGNGWEVRIQHGGRRHSKTVATRSDAQFLEARLRQRVNDNRAGRESPHSIEEAVQRWLKEELPRLKSQKTYSGLVRAILPHLKGQSLDDVPAVAQAIKNEGMARELSPATINRRLALLKRWAKLAYKRWGWVGNDVGAKIELLSGERRRTEWVTPAEGRRLMAAAAPQIREAIRWALLTGLRRGEILSLTPVSFKDRAVYLPDSKSGHPRAVPLPPELDPRRFPFGIHPTALSKGFQEARERAGLPHIRFHDLRRSYGTWLLQGRADLGAVRDLLGHSNISMTSRYLGSSVQHLRRSIKSLPSLGLSRGRKIGPQRVNRGRTKDV